MIASVICGPCVHWLSSSFLKLTYHAVQCVLGRCKFLYATVMIYIEVGLIGYLYRYTNSLMGWGHQSMARAWMQDSWVLKRYNNIYLFPTVGFYDFGASVSFNQNGKLQEALLVVLESGAHYIVSSLANRFMMRYDISVHQVIHTQL